MSFVAALSFLACHSLPLCSLRIMAPMAPSKKSKTTPAASSRLAAIQPSTRTQTQINDAHVLQAVPDSENISVMGSSESPAQRPSHAPTQVDLSTATLARSIDSTRPEDTGVTVQEGGYGEDETEEQLQADRRELEAQRADNGKGTRQPQVCVPVPHEYIHV